MRTFLYGINAVALSASWVALMIAVARWYDAPGGMLGETGPWPIAVLCVASASWALMLRRDAYAACLFIAGGGAFGGLLGSGLVLGLNERGLVPLAVLVGSGAAAAAGFGACAWFHWRRPRADEVLARTFGRDLGDMRGVFMLFELPPSAEPGGVVRLRVFLENAWTGPRTVSFAARSHGSGHDGLVLAERVWTVRMEPRTAGVLTVPLGFDPAANGRILIQLNPSVTGDRGRRAIPRRGRTIQRRASTGMRFLAVAVAQVDPSGGIDLAVDVRPPATPPHAVPERPKVDPPFFISADVEGGMGGGAGGGVTPAGR